MLFTTTTGKPTAPAIVFLHGAGLSGRMWQPQMERLTDYYCLAPDLPAQGKSLDVAPFQLEDAACLKHSKMIVVPGIGHVWNLQAPNLFTETVRNWIEDRPIPERTVAERCLLGIQTTQHQLPAPIHERCFDHLIIGRARVCLQNDS